MRKLVVAPGAKVKGQKEKEGGSALRKACPQVPDVYTWGGGSFWREESSVDLHSSAEISGPGLNRRGQSKKERMQENNEITLQGFGPLIHLFSSLSSSVSKKGMLLIISSLEQ